MQMTVEGSFSKIVSKTLLGKLSLCERETIFLLVNPLHTHTHKYIFIPGSFVINVYDVSWKTFPTWKETIIALSLSLCFHALLTLEGRERDHCDQFEQRERVWEKKRGGGGGRSLCPRLLSIPLQF